MKRFLVPVLFALLLGTAHGQPTYVGVSFGVTTFFVQPRISVSGHVGLPDLIADRWGVRADLSANVSTAIVEFGANVLYSGRSEAPQSVAPYGGGGLRLMLFTDGGSPGFGLGGVGGVEFAASGALALFAEARVNVYLFGRAFLGVAAGMNFRL